MERNINSTVPRAICVTIALCCALLGLTDAAVAYPTRSVEMTIVFPPGGALDVVARALAKEAEGILGQSLIPSNQPGGGGIPGVTSTARAKADGYHLVATVSNALIFQPHLHATPYRPLRDLAPVLSFGQAAPLLVVSPHAPWNSVDEFLAAVRKKEGGMRVGVPGLGSPSHIVLMMMSKQDPELVWRFVPFGGPGEAETALLGGHVDVAVSGAVPRIKSGQMKALLTLAGQRLPALPDVPALADKGFPDPGKGDATFLLLAPSGTPEEVLTILEAAFLKAAKSAAFQNAVEKFSVTSVIRGRAETKAFLRDAWREESAILRATGLGDAPMTAPE